jgi:hypothetical protein
MPHRLAPVIFAGWLVLAGTAPAQEKLSGRLHDSITASLPKYEPLVVVVEPQGTTITKDQLPLGEEPIYVMPNFMVREKRPPTRDPDVWLSQRALKHKALLDYRSSMTDLEWALNSWHIPLPFGFSLTPSAQARASARYTERKILREQTRLKEVAAAVATIDPIEAKKLLRDLDLTRLPGR